MKNRKIYVRQRRGGKEGRTKKKKALSRGDENRLEPKLKQTSVEEQKVVWVWSKDWLIV